MIEKSSLHDSRYICSAIFSDITKDDILGFCLRICIALYYIFAGSDD